MAATQNPKRKINSLNSRPTKDDVKIQDNQNNQPTNTLIFKSSASNVVQNSDCTTTLQKDKVNEKLSNGLQNSCTKSDISNVFKKTDSDTGSDVKDGFDLSELKEQKFRQNECCNTEKWGHYFWLVMRFTTQIFLCLAVFVCLIASKVSFQFIANGIDRRNDAGLNNGQHLDQHYVFVCQLVICLMVPDIFKLFPSLWQLVIYRRIRSRSCIQESTNDNDSTVRMSKKLRWFKQNSYEMKHICLEFLQCNAMYTFAFIVFPILSSLEFCVFTAGISIISCMIRMLGRRCDFSAKKTVFYVIFAVLYCVGLSGMVFVIGYKTLILYGKSRLILASISMLLFGLRWLPLTDKQQERGISNISHVISGLVRIVTAVILTPHFYPDAVSITYFVKDIIRKCGFHSITWHIANQSHSQLLHNLSNPCVGIKHKTLCIPYEYYVPFLIFIITSLLCYHFATLACRLRMQLTSFALPLTIALPVYVAYLFIMEMEAIPNDKFGLVSLGKPNATISILLFGSFVLLWTCQMWSCRNIWKEQKEHLPETGRLFNCPSYFGPFNDISLMNSRKQEPAINKARLHTEESKSLLNINFDDDENNKMRPIIFVCATMWHETLEEMKILITSLLRLDYDHHACRRRQPHSYIYEDEFDLDNVEMRKKEAKCLLPNPSKQYMYFDRLLMVHIFFDDAFELIDGSGKGLNAFVNTFHSAINDVIREHYSTEFEIKQVFEYTTPYGCRKVWTLPGKNKLTVHFKDKKLIRNKKRWSQVMYFNYILKRKVSEISKETHFDRKNVEDNIFILTLDGDVSFTPSAVKKLFTKIHGSSKIGAVTGRSIPCGSGPVIWFQKFEYAVGHWLWKTAEQVFGSVLCAPGCFSIYRGTAILTTGVLDTYSKIPSTPREFLQFDQGEDRWLCTLLLKEGYHVEYISDAACLTAAPEDLPEFLRQRRRWIASVIANLLDIKQCSNILRKRNSAISMFYIVYILLLLSVSLFTSSIALWGIEMSLLSLTTVEPWIAFIVTYVPFIVHLAVCAQVKSKDTQHNVTFVLTIFYACLMVLITIGQVAAFLHAGWSKYSFVYLLPYLTPALLHISEFHNLIHFGIFYILYPFAYGLLNTYSVCNMNDISWGTRESKTKKENHKSENDETILNIYNDIKSEIGHTTPVCKFLKSLIKIKLIESLHTTEIIDVEESNNKIEQVSVTPIGQDNIEKEAIMSIFILRRSENKFWEDLIKETLEPMNIADGSKNSLMNDFQIYRNKWVLGYCFLNFGIILFRKCLGVLNIKLIITIYNLHFTPFGFLMFIIFSCLTLLQLLGLIIFKYNSFLDNVSRTIIR